MLIISDECCHSSYGLDLTAFLFFLILGHALSVVLLVTYWLLIVTYWLIVSCWCVMIRFPLLLSCKNTWSDRVGRPSVHPLSTGHQTTRIFKAFRLMCQLKKMAFLSRGGHCIAEGERWSIDRVFLLIWSLQTFWLNNQDVTMARVFVVVHDTR